MNSLLDTLHEWETALRACDENSNTVTQDNCPGSGDDEFQTLIQLLSIEPR